MALTIRVADLGADRELIIDVLRRYLTPRSDTARFEWLYRANPHGPAAAWIAVDGDRGETVGMASAFPRRAFWDGREERCWVLGDFCIHEAYRTLGPAVQLNRTCLAGMNEGIVAFCYDFPSDRMMAVYRRLGIGPFGRMIRFAKVLRWGAKLRAAVAVPGVRVGLGIIGDIVDQWPARSATPPRGMALALEATTCDDAFDDLDLWNRGRLRLHLERSAAYLNWRYRANPIGRYDILAARRGGELQGYAVFTRSGSDGVLADLTAREDGTATLLLDGVASHLRAGGAATFSVPVFASHPLVPALIRCGFRARETSPVILHRRSDAEPARPLSAGDWPLMHGDRDS